MSSSQTIMPWQAVAFPHRSTSSLRLIKTGSSRPGIIWGSSRPWEFTPFPERFPTSKTSAASNEAPMLRKMSWRNYSSLSPSVSTVEIERKNSSYGGNTPGLSETNFRSQKKFEQGEPELDNLSISSSSSISSVRSSSSCSSPLGSVEANQPPKPSQIRKKSKRILTPEEQRRKKLIMRARQVLLLTDDGFRSSKSG
jgi:hypothetical protein